MANHSRLIDYNFAFTPGYIWLNYGQGNFDVGENWIEPTNFITESIKLLNGALNVVNIYNSIPTPTASISRFNSSRAVINLSKEIPVMKNMDDVKKVINLSKYETVQESVMTEVFEKTGKNLFKEAIFNSAYQIALDYILGSVTATYAFPAWVVMDNVNLKSKNNYNAQVVGLHQDIVNEIYLPTNSEIGMTSEWNAYSAHYGMRDALIDLNLKKTYDASIFMTNATLNGSSIDIKCDMGSLLTGGKSGENQVIEPFRMYINVNGSYGNLVLVGVEEYG